jgi:hypothetical protein
VLEHSLRVQLPIAYGLKSTVGVEQDRHHVATRGQLQLVEGVLCHAQHGDGGEHLRAPVGQRSKQAGAGDLPGCTQLRSIQA